MPISPKFSPEFAVKVEHALAVITHPKFREFTEATKEAARQILRTAVAIHFGKAA